MRRSFVLREDVRRYVSVPQPIAFPTGGGETAHAFYYPPFSPEFAAPADEKAPVSIIGLECPGLEARTGVESESYCIRVGGASGKPRSGETGRRSQSFNW